MAEHSLNRVAVGFGGDERSHDALALAIALARSAGATLDVILVLKEDDPFNQAYPPVGNVQGIIAEQAQQWIREAQAVIPAEVTHHSHVRPARSVAEGLVDAVKELGSDVLVTGSGIGFGRIMTHPAVTALLHSAPVPVALAPAGYRATTRITDVMGAVSAAHPQHQVAETSEGWAAQLGAALSFVTFQEGDAASAGNPESRGTTTAKHLVASGKTLRHAVDTVDWPQGAILLIGSSPLARRRHIFLGMTAARVLSHLPIPMVLLPRDLDSSAPDAR
ncbi:universal stress protein [Nesterenkonia sp. Act20]|uniref:universal stress protein n=1 Tax=Nesterenkonia sp. Act20 TaxID=1483432 RepID=UPI001C4613D3|nr:universal stress protein [Nesterenkonia sp. Act20]